MVLGTADPVGCWGHGDERQQHFGEHPPSSQYHVATAGSDRQPIHACHARRPLDRQLIDWDFRKSIGRKPRAVDQWRACSSGTVSCRTKMVSLTPAEGGVSSPSPPLSTTLSNSWCSQSTNKMIE